MRDCRSYIVENTLMTLVRNGVKQNIIDETKSVLLSLLDKFEVQERCTEVAIIDDSYQRALIDFLKTKQIEGKSINTLKRYKYELEQLLNFYHKKLEEYTTEDIRIYLSYRKNNGKYKNGLSNRTLDGMRKCYSSFFKWATGEKIISWNPCIAVGQIKYTKVVKKPFSSVEMQKLREACKTKREIALVDWFYSTGCRVGEVATTTLSSIDWEQKTAIVTGKGDKQRTVYMTDICAMHIKEYINSRNDFNDALFVSNRGTALTIGGIQAMIKKIGERAGILDTHCHRFRHTLASYLASKMPIMEVAAILGHTNIETTSIYVHVDDYTTKAHYRNVMAA